MSGTRAGSDDVHPAALAMNINATASRRCAVIAASLKSNAKYGFPQVFISSDEPTTHLLGSSYHVRKVSRAAPAIAIEATTKPRTGKSLDRFGHPIAQSTIAATGKR